MIALNNSVINSTPYFSHLTVKKNEIECLVRLYYSLVGKASGKLANARMDCNTFRGILHNIFGMTDDALMNRGKGSQQTEMTKQNLNPSSCPFHKTGLALRAKPERNDSVGEGCQQYLGVGVEVGAENGSSYKPTQNLVAQSR